MECLMSPKSILQHRAKKSLFCLMKEVQKHNFNIVTLLSLFDTYVSPILNYCSDIWGYIKAQEIEKVHTMFLKKVIRCKTFYK